MYTYIHIRKVHIIRIHILLLELALIVSLIIKQLRTDEFIGTVLTCTFIVAGPSRLARDHREHFETMAR